jgi:plastocyanin
MGIGLVLAVAGLWGAASAALAADKAVKIVGFAFAPSTVTVSVGDTVTWSNGDSVGHTATAADGAFDTGAIAEGTTASITLSKAGTYAYACKIHPAMTGTIVVEAAASGGSSGGVASPPATDMVSPASTARHVDGIGLIAALLAVLGAAMIVGTVLIGRRAARASGDRPDR